MLMQAEEEHLRRDRREGSGETVECMEEDCLEEPRLERSRAGAKGPQCQAQGWPVCREHVCEGESCVAVFSLHSFSPSGKDAHCSPGPP